MSRQSRGLPVYVYRGSNHMQDAEHVESLLWAAGGEGLAKPEQREACLGLGSGVGMTADYLGDLDDDPDSSLFDKGGKGGSV
jgi:hypothetical protein